MCNCMGCAGDVCMGSKHRIEIPVSGAYWLGVGPSKRADEIVRQQAHDAARMRRVHAVRAKFDALRDRVRNQYRSAM